MKFSISQSELQNALSVVVRGISSRSTLPILSGILINAKDDEIVLKTTNLELSIRYKANALVEEEGSVVVPGKLFSDIVKNLPDAAVSLSLEGETAQITCEQSSFTIKTLAASDFPSFPEVTTSQQIEIPYPTFVSMVKKVSRAVSKDGGRAILTGIYIHTNGEVLTMVATDSYRLAISKAAFENTDLEDFDAVIPGSFLQELTGLQRTENMIRLALSENQIVIDYNETVFVNRRLEGNFPNYRQLLPDSYTTRVEVDTSEITNAVRRASLINTSSPHIKCVFDPQNKLLSLSASSQDVGSAQETIMCEGDGEAIDIAFNSHYLLEGLSSIDEKTLYIELQNSSKPGILKNQDGTFIYLVMPVRI